MSNQSQYGETLLLRNIQDASSAQVLKHAIQAKNLNRIEVSKEYLNAIVAFVPGAQLKETKSRTAWNVADRDGHALRIDALLTDETRREAWVRAIADLQQKITESSED